MSRTRTWDDAINTAKDAVEQILLLDQQGDDGEAHPWVGFMQAGALMVLGALSIPRDGSGDGVYTIRELIKLGVRAVDVDVDEEP